jgi:hypothetical protein
MAKVNARSDISVVNIANWSDVFECRWWISHMSTNNLQHPHWQSVDITVQKSSLEGERVEQVNGEDEFQFSTNKKADLLAVVA